jgi:integrase
MGVSDWRFHDLRRTAASGMARIGVAPHVIEKVLNHVSGQISGVAAVYNRHGYDAEKRNALELWAEHVTQLVATGKRAAGRLELARGSVSSGPSP